MKRRIAATLLVTLLPLSMTGCSISSKVSACEELSAPLKEAGVVLLKVSLGETEDEGPAFSQLAEAYETASAKISDSKVKASVDQVAADWRTVAEKVQALSEDPANLSDEKQQDFQAAFKELKTHQTELFHTCGYKY